ncbi:hypothetical protein BGZ79_005720 [Entomortierella chlamydospora]|nr:hypothetical protein BGZ79_005720 [Entomortierella chlamydospora]
MSKRQLSGQIRQPAISAQIQSAIPRFRSLPSPAPQTDAAGSSLTPLKASSFWVQKGMNTFIDWITNPQNHERLYKKNPESGQKPTDVRQEIANFVNSRHNTKWTEIQVKSKIAYTKVRYREAAHLNPTGQGNVTAKQLEICPEFMRLREVYGGSLDANPPPPRQSVSFGDKSAAVNDTDEESSDLDATRDSPDSNPHANTQTDLSYENEGPANKRRKDSAFMSPTMHSTSVEMLQNLSEQQIMANYERKTELRQRELVIEQRERELTEKLFRLSEETSRRAEEASRRAVEARERLRLDLAAEKAQFRQEIAAERAEFKKEMADERAEIKKERSEIIALKAENAALKRELEVRNYRPVNNL